MCAKLTPLSHCALASKQHHLISFHNGIQIASSRFNLDVRTLVDALSDLNENSFAIFYEQAYPFCVSFFALLHGGKQVWIANNNTEATAKQLTQLGCILLGDWQGLEIELDLDNSGYVELKPLNVNNHQLTLFTSGSSGKAKPIKKNLQQLQREIETLEDYWGNYLGSAQVLGTVSHQHIYGLLFRILWPLAAGRCFHSEMFLSPETLLNAACGVSACWIASPAQLKRLDALTPWQDIKKMITIFSSGGDLSLESAEQIFHCSGHKVLEVYGSSETGGIGWRQSMNSEAWVPFSGISLKLDDMGLCHLTSPYLADSSSIILDDKIQLLDDGGFKLLGRVDRIVKVEEKRLSLNELEQHLNDLEWIVNSYTMRLAEKRDKISAIVVLSRSGVDFISQYGRAKLIKQIRSKLMAGFETVVLPRKWLFMNSLPLTTQGKINQQLLTELLTLNGTQYPQILNCDVQIDTVELQLRVKPALVYFSGHFPEQAILPGVTQLAWVEKFGKIFFAISLPFLRMEVIKFKKIIQPGDIILMKLTWKSSSNKLYFQLDAMNDGEMHSSGRMVYGEQ